MYSSISTLFFLKKMVNNIPFVLWQIIMLSLLSALSGMFEMTLVMLNIYILYKKYCAF